MTLADPNDPRHGTLAGYGHHRCRCTSCKAAQAAWMADYRRRNPDRERTANRAAKTPDMLTADDPRHGRAVAYRTFRCRCDACREYKRQSEARYSQKPETKERRARHYESNRERLLAESKRRYAEDPQAARERRARYYAEKADEIKQRTAAYQAANPEQTRERYARYRASAEGMATRRAARMRRRARKRAQDCGCVTAEAMHAVWEQDQGRCAYCGGGGEDYDHVIPLAHGGRHCVSNLRVACGRCNNSKNARPLAEFLADLAARGVTIMPNATAPGLPCLWADMRAIEDPWKVA